MTNVNGNPSEPARPNSSALRAARKRLAVRVSIAIAAVCVLLDVYGSAVRHHGRIAVTLAVCAPPVIAIACGLVYLRSTRRRP